MKQRRRFKHQQSLEQRLEDEAMRLWKEARGIGPRIERDRLLRRARQAENGLANERVATIAGSGAAGLRP
jgi:hypothetical protein